MDIRSAFKFRFVKFIKPLIVMVVLTIVLYVLSLTLSYYQAFKYASLYMVCSIVLLLIIFLFNLARHYVLLGSINKKDVERDILNPLTKKYAKSRVFLGKKYIVSNNNNLYITELNNISWAFPDKDKNTIVAYNKIGIKMIIADHVNPKEIDKILKEMWNINSNILIGYDKETQDRYANMRKASHK